MLAGRTWRRKYTPDDGELVRLFYVPALEDAERYDRLTGYFGAGALALAARGIEGLVRNRGHMRLVVGCTLPPAEIEAIERGAKLRRAGRAPSGRAVTGTSGSGRRRRAGAAGLDGGGRPSRREGRRPVRRTTSTDPGRRHLPRESRYRDRPRGRPARLERQSQRDRGRLGAQLGEHQRLHQLGAGAAKRVADEEANFARIWGDQAKRVIVLDTPEAVRRDLMRFMPDSDQPARLRAGKEPTPPPVVPVPGVDDPPTDDEVEPAIDLRSRVWAFIDRAPALPHAGARVGEATAAVIPWPHQVRAFERLYAQWPPRLLIADEVGLGKTIQAGLLLRQAWLAGRAKRILILAPKAVLRQWQIELREKFNLNWPIYDGRQLVRYPSPALRGRERRPVDPDAWHTEPAVIASSHLMRRHDRAKVLLEDAAPWDLVVLDEAHHARRRAAGSAQEGGPNALLRLMQTLKDRARRPAAADGDADAGPPH